MKHHQITGGGGCRLHVVEAGDPQGPAILFLVLAFIGCVVTLVTYKRYALLRNRRWQNELAGTENALNQELNLARMTIIMEHTTGPLGPAPEAASEATTAGEEPPVDKP